MRDGVRRNSEFHISQKINDGKGCAKYLLAERERDEDYAQEGVVV